MAHAATLDKAAASKTSVWSIRALRRVAEPAHPLPQPDALPPAVQYRSSS